MEVFWLFAIIAVVVIIIVAQNNKKKKQAAERAIKEQKEKERIKRERERKIEEERLEILELEASKITEVEFPELYFESMCVECFTADISVEEKIEMAKKIVSTYSGFDVDGYLKGLKILDENIEHFTSLFISSQEEMDRYMREYSSDEIDERISGEICMALKMVGHLMDFWNIYRKFMSTYYNPIIAQVYKLIGLFVLDATAHKEDGEIFSESVDRFLNEYKFATEIKWKELCKKNPELNNEYYEKEFYEFAKYDEAFLKWRDFYSHKLLSIYTEWGITDLKQKVSSFIKTIEGEYGYIHKNISEGGFGEYSSIHEIDDFSEEEIERILNLYQSGEMKGVYKKANDPKYNKQI